MLLLCIPAIYQYSGFLKATQYVCENDQSWSPVTLHLRKHLASALASIGLAFATCIFGFSRFRTAGGGRSVYS